MNALFIILGVILGLILLCLCLILFGKAKIRILCKGEVQVIASILGIRFRLYPERDKTNKNAERLRQGADPDKILKRELKKQRRALKKAEKKKQKAKAKALQKKKLREVSGQPDPNLIENLQMILALIKKLYAYTKGAIRIKVRKMHITVATEDAAKTAVTYGIVVQSAAYLLEWIETHFAHIERRDGDMTITPDYLSETMTSDIDISFSIGIKRAIGIAVGMFNAYKVEKRIALKKAKKRKTKRVNKLAKKIINK